MPDQGLTLDVQESQTVESALRDDWTWNVPHHTLEVVLEITLEHMYEEKKILQFVTQAPLSKFKELIVMVF